MTLATTAAQRLTCADCGLERPAQRIALFEGRHYCDASAGTDCLERAWDRSARSDGLRVNGTVRERVQEWAERRMAGDAAATVEVLVAEGLKVFAADAELAGLVVDGAGPRLVREEVRAALVLGLAPLAERQVKALLQRLVAEGVTQLRGDRDAARALLEDVLPPVVRESLEGALRPKDGRLGGALEARAAAFGARFSKWSQWVESVGGGRVKLLDMDKSQLLAAARDRTARAGQELHLAALWRRLADGLAEGQTVRERFSTEAIDKLAAETSELAQVTEATAAAV